MKLGLFIAKRYLFASRSHNVINVISGISAAGMALGTAALVMVMSVYNGFDSLVRDMMGNVEPDLLVVPAEGKVFVPQGPAYEWAYACEDIGSMCTVLQDNVFLSHDGRQTVAVAKGVDSIYEEESPLKEHIREGALVLHRGQVPLGCFGIGLARALEVSPRFISDIKVCFPDREAGISMTDPAASLRFERIWAGGVFAVNADIDGSLVILPIETMRSLLGYSDEVSAVEIRLRGGTSAKRCEQIRRELSDRLGDGFRVCDRYMQNPTLYRMMRYEKASIYLILLFMIVVIAFNIFGSLSMLIIEKEDDMDTLRAMGATEGFLKKVFVLEGWMISLLGMAAGLVAGLGAVLAQNRWGIVKMPGSFLVNAYPVVLSWTDTLLACLSVAAVGYIIALLSVRSRFRKEA